ncbi:thiol-disulfide oxidoreductase DCC family protein [Zhongshania sp. BJYM1]|uniref:thiol-disulfide oxidoreductase DCC family protein n=1 Tax=Zhongshania aquatica TaxID=2965069 RepID=UPI0022B3555B|nr:DCC1-like thiol-disulfide oxidoreductase family protein [Marortus sp. BJYM1]
MTLSNKEQFIKEANNVILFDGVCKLCHAWSRFIIRFDKSRHFKLCAVQSDEGAAIMTYYQLRDADQPSDHYDSMYYLENGHVFQKSAAFLQIMAAMPYPWRILRIFVLIPGVLRDYGYDFIAKNRYVIFGKYGQCLLPSADHAQRFLCFETVKH